MCASVRSVKYLYKYVYKGYDCVNAEIKINNTDPVENIAQLASNVNQYDEIKQYLNARLFILKYIKIPCF